MELHPSLKSVLTWLELATEVADCYRLLGLRSGASLAEIQASYQRLARQYHPDINSVEQGAKDKFIALTEAYKLLVSIVEPAQTDNEHSGNSEPAMSQDTTGNTPLRLELELQLKWRSYHQLQQFLKSERFPRAIALVEGLAQRLPHDPEVRQWQASTYQRWGRQLMNEKQLDKARIYLKKALKTDPHNRALWFEVERDFRRLEQILSG